MKNPARKEYQTAMVASYQQLPSLCDELEKNCLGTIAEVEVRCRLGGRFGFALPLFFGFSLRVFCAVSCSLSLLATCMSASCQQIDYYIHNMEYTARPNLLEEVSGVLRYSTSFCWFKL